MIKFGFRSLSLALAMVPLAAAAQQYNPVPASDMPMFAQCINYTNGKYTGGDAASPVPGQTKAQAFCTCMWNETAEDFKGNLAAFAETPKGAAMNKTCEKYANWE